MRLALVVDRSHTVQECCDRLAERLPWNDAKRKSLGQRLEEANTLRDRYVLLLYWLVRRREARDFSYAKNLEAETAKTLYDKFGHETAVCKAADPEKQHIVPVSRLKAAFGVDERIRNARHPANNIGTLTYISQVLNGLDGLSDKFACLADEPADNRHSHFMDEDALRLYQSCGEAKPDSLKQLFGEFCARRRQLIQDDLEDWLKQLRPAFAVSERLEPHPRLFAPDPGDRVRQFAFPDPVEDALLSMLGHGDLVFTDSLGKPRFYLGGKKPKAAEVFFFTGDRIEIEDKPGAPLMDLLRRITAEKALYSVSDCPACGRVHNPPRWGLPASSPDTAIVLGMLAHAAPLAVAHTA